MPNRVIKDWVWSSPSLAKLEPYYQDQWLRWLLMADDWGCFNADPEVIKGKVYPKRKETVKIVLKIRNIFYNAGKLFVWTDENERTWGFFASWDRHQFCSACGIDEEGKYTKHRRKTPPPPEKELNEYFDKFRQVETEFVIPNPIPNPNPTLRRDKVKGKRESKLEKDMVIKKSITPTNKMFGVFQSIWLTRREKEYKFVGGKDGKTAQRIWRQCVKDSSDNPLDYFTERVRLIMEQHDIWAFGGIEQFWNSVTPKKKGKSWID